MKNIVKTIASILLTAAILLTTACSASGSIKNATFGEVRKEFNTALDVSNVEFTQNGAPASYEKTVEAEDAVLSGGVKAVSRPEFSAGAGVTGLNSENDGLVFEFDIENSGFYDISVTAYSKDIGRQNDAFLDGEKIGQLVCTVSGGLEDISLKNIYMEKGSHELSIVKNWGWVDYDCMKITASSIDHADIYNVTASLSNKNADDNTKRLYNFLKDIYGKYTLSGQFADKSRESNEYKAIKDVTGKEFAVLGLDMMGYDSQSISNGSNPDAVERAYDWYANCGGIVQLCWHWRSPDGYVKSGSPWYGSFYSENSTIDLDKAMNGEDDKLLELLIKDIDMISSQLARLRDAGVPVIWRPLHEASGGWFWWGSCSAESSIKLWKLMYERMTVEHGLTNLIWMWNGQSKDWYPGDEYCDIVSTDIYPGERQYASQAASFIECVECSGERKLIALSENGCIPDPDLMHRDNARWLFFGVWSGDFTIKFDDAVYNEQYTDKDMLKKVYNSENVLTLDELPDLRKYRND